jgi:NAD(P)-dependent dehydrogenase (short-subunit alcohol dehydrogenase family)
MKDFAGKTAFVTGGAGGIGLAMARTFGRRGMKVAIADVEADTCAKVVEALKAEGITAIGFACDVADRDR